MDDIQDIHVSARTARWKSDLLAPGGGSRPTAPPPPLATVLYCVKRIAKNIVIHAKSSSSLCLIVCGKSWQTPRLEMTVINGQQASIGPLNVNELKYHHYFIFSTVRSLKDSWSNIWKRDSSSSNSYASGTRWPAVGDEDVDRRR